MKDSEGEQNSSRRVWLIRGDAGSCFVLGKTMPQAIDFLVPQALTNPTKKSSQENLNFDLKPDAKNSSAKWELKRVSRCFILHFITPPSSAKVKETAARRLQIQRRWFVWSQSTTSAVNCHDQMTRRTRFPDCESVQGPRNCDRKSCEGGRSRSRRGRYEIMGRISSDVKMFFRLLLYCSRWYRKVIVPKDICLCFLLSTTRSAAAVAWESERRRRGNRKFIVVEPTYGIDSDTFHSGVGFPMAGSSLLPLLSMALSYEGIKWKEGGTFLSSSMLLTPKITS